MTLWQVIALLGGLMLVAAATYVVGRSCYRQQRVVLGTAAVSWAAGVWAVASALT